MARHSAATRSRAPPAAANAAPTALSMFCQAVSQPDDRGFDGPLTPWPSVLSEASARRARQYRRGFRTTTVDAQEQSRFVRVGHVWRRAVQVRHNHILCCQANVRGHSHDGASTGLRSLVLLQRLSQVTVGQLEPLPRLLRRNVATSDDDRCLHFAAALLQ